MAETAARESFDLLMFRRLWRLLRFLFPGLFSLPVALFLFLLFLSFLEEVVSYFMGLVPSKYYTVFEDRDWDGFMQHTLQAFGMIVSIAIVKSVKKYVDSVLYITWRQLLCFSLHRLYFSGINYYTLNILDNRVDNPDQRMTQDVDKLCLTLSTITAAIVIAPFKIGYYTYRTYVGTGWLGTLSVYSLFVVGTVANKLVMSPIVRFVVKQEKCEGNFRFKHMQVRVDSESVAFHVSGRVEASKTNRLLDCLVRAQQQLFDRQILLNATRTFFDYLGSIVSYLAIAIPIFGGKFDDQDDIAAIVSAYSFVCMYLVFSLTSLLDLAGKVVLLSGVTHRVAQLVEALLQLQVKWDITTLQASSSFSNIIHTCKRRHTTNKDSSPSDSRGLLEEGGGEEEVMVVEGGREPLHVAFILRDVDIVIPGSSTPLIHQLQLEVCRGESVLVMGPSSCGKSSLLRVLRGLWPAARGTVAHDLPPGPSAVLFLPQKPLLTNGSLLEQIIYPLRLDPHNPLGSEVCSELLALLEALHMTGLVTRAGGLHHDPEWHWNDALSPGEMQRVCFLRVLFHKPQFALLDEATSALSLDVEEQLYRACLERGITLISVGHRLSLRQYHYNLLTLDGNGGWTFEPIGDPQGNNSLLAAASPLSSSSASPSARDDNTTS